MKFNRKFNKDSKVNENEGAFFNIDTPSHDKGIIYLDDADYQGTIIKVIKPKKNKAYAIQIQVEGIEDIFTTFIYVNLARSFAWREPIKEAQIKYPSELEGMDIIFSISNNEVDGKVYSNLYSIELFPPSQDEDGEDEDDLLEDE